MKEFEERQQGMPAEARCGPDATKANILRHGLNIAMKREMSQSNHPNDYSPPRIWTQDGDNGGKFASINRPVAGPTHEQDLPVGEHPHQL